jgi:hypothetical protein
LLLHKEAPLSFTDALRGYAYQVHLRDGFKCVYCGLDGKQSFSAWLSLSLDHLLPKGHPNRNDPEFMVTACMFCNVADNQYFVQAEARGIAFDGKTRHDLVAQRLPYVSRTRESYKSFWETRVLNSEAAASGGAPFTVSQSHNVSTAAQAVREGGRRMTRMPAWTLDEFRQLVTHPDLDDSAVMGLIPSRSTGAIGAVRAGLHSYHRGQNISMLSRIMVEELDNNQSKYVCPVCKGKLSR